MTEAPRFPTREAAIAYADQTHSLAETAAEIRISHLVRQWACWHHRWSTKPTPANNAREKKAWDRLRLALHEADMEDTWLDPLD